MKSHELAARLREVADRIEAHEECNIPSPRLSSMSHNREEFVAMAKLFGGTKDPSDSYFYYVRSKYGDLDVDLMAPRSLVCRVVLPAREAVYECEPLLSAAEEGALAST